MNVKDYLNKAVEIHRIMYVAVAGLGILIFYTWWFLYQKKQAEDINEHLISMCFMSCLEEKGGSLDKGLNYSDYCMKYCEQKYPR